MQPDFELSAVIYIFVSEIFHFSGVLGIKVCSQAL